MNKRLIISVLAIWMITYGFAQVNLNRFYQDYLDTKRHSDTFFKNVEGSQYENEEFREAEVYLKGNDSVTKFQLRYNNLTDEMEIKNRADDTYLVVNNKNLIDSIILNNEVYIYLNTTYDKIRLNGFYIQLISGKFTLLQKRTREFIPERKPTGGYQEYVKPSIEPRPVEYYLIGGDGVPVLLPGNMQGIVKLLKKKGYELAEIVKQNKLKYNKEGILQLILFLNAL